MANSKLNIPRISFIPANSGSLENGVFSNLSNRSAYPYFASNVNPFFPTILPFSKKINVPSSLSPQSFDISFINIFEHTSKIESGHLGFLIDSVITHPSISPMSARIMGGIINSSLPTSDSYSLEYSESTYTTPIGGLINISPNSLSWLYCDEEGTSVENPPSFTLKIGATLNNTSSTSLANVLVSGIITLI